MMSLWDALRMNMMISYQELVRTFPNNRKHIGFFQDIVTAIKKLLTARLFRMSRVGIIPTV